MKNKKLKIIFLLSFLPYIILIIISLYYAIFGHNVSDWLGHYIRTDYGMEAFLDTLFLNALGLCFLPVLPTVAVYQIVYIILFIIKKLNKK